MDLVFHREPELMEELRARASKDDLYILLRAQKRMEHRILLSNGKTERITTFHLGGIGFQLFDGRGYHAFASLDTLSGADIHDVYDTARAGIQAASGRGYGKFGAFPSLSPEKATIELSLKYDFDAVSVGMLEQKLRETHLELLHLFPDLKLETSFQVTHELWNIKRSDGTDVTFPLARCFVGHTFFGSAAGGGSVSSSAVYSTPSYELLLEREHREKMFKRARTAARRVGEVAGAEHVPAGEYDILIDYALAKGLAHEALGHAAESDSFRSSILAKEGKFRCGDRISSPIVSVVDESMDGDFAYQPYSANGCRRECVKIINRGVLENALTDLFSSESLGLPLTGAGRAENYRCIPRPRMSNIRIEIEDPEPIDEEFEDLEVEQIREILVQAGLLGKKKKILYLTGYRGGQVNPVVGDFVFNCSAIYEFSKEGIRPFRAALFCGQITEALKAIRKAFGPLRLDAVGLCGKWGQNVPSSGGSHYFLFIEKNKNVTIGGTAKPGRSRKAVPDIPSQRLTDS